jgi:hypothetical protein
VGFHKTITVDFRDEATDFQLFGDGKAFLKGVMAFIFTERFSPIQ